jgi:hypothetical protein
MKRFFPLLLAFAFIGCPATTPAPGIADCATVCTNMVKLNCPSAKPTAKGATCEQVCLNFQLSGISTWNLSCRSTALSCVAADACEAGK